MMFGYDKEIMETPYGRLRSDYSELEQELDRYKRIVAQRNEQIAALLEACKTVIATLELAIAKVEGGK